MITPHPLNDLDETQLRRLAAACYPAILKQLTGQGTQETDVKVAFERPRKEK